MKEWRGKMWINGEKTRRRLAIDPLSHAHHFAGKLKLVFFTPTCSMAEFEKARSKD